MTMHPGRLQPGIIELKDAADEDPAAVVTKALDELSKTVETRLGAIEAKAGEVAKITARLDAVEIRMARPAITGRAPKEGDEAAAIERKAFTSFVRGGVERMGADEVKALTVSTETQGGYLAPQEFVAELDRNLVQFSPVRSVARVASTMSGSVRLPRRTGAMTAAWTAETATRSSTGPTFGANDIPIHEIACYTDASNQILEDSGIDIASELAFDFAEEFGRAEGAAFVGGDGIGKPLGLLNTPGIGTVPSGDANGFPVTTPADKMIDVFYSLPTAYAANGTWAMNRTTMGTVRKFKTADGAYLWQDGLQAGQPATILGRPVVEMPDLPDVAAGKLPIVFGDFRHFRIFDRIALSIVRDPYSIATTGQVRFHGRRRVGGGVTKTEAFKFLRIAVS